MQDFDIRTATLDGWEKYLCEAENHERVFFGDFEKPSRSPLERAIEAFVTSDAEIEERLAAVTYAVQATLNKWDLISEVGGGPLALSTSPLACLPRMAYVDNAISEPLLNIIQRLWRRARKNGNYTKHSVRTLLYGLGAYAPIDNDTVAKIYREYFSQYSFIALIILLDRGEVALATELFDEYASGFGDFDPLSLDVLVHKGLTFASAKKWLDQGLNSKPGYEENYNNALERWKKIADRLALQAT